MIHCFCQTLIDYNNIHSPVSYSPIILVRSMTAFRSFRVLSIRFSVCAPCHVMTAHIHTNCTIFTALLRVIVSLNILESRSSIDPVCWRLPLFDSKILCHPVDSLFLSLFISLIPLSLSLVLLLLMLFDPLLFSIFPFRPNRLHVFLLIFHSERAGI